MRYYIFYRYACSLLRQEMKQIVITLDSPDMEALEKQGDKENIMKVQISRIGVIIILFVGV